MTKIRDAILLEWILSGKPRERDKAFEYLYRNHYASVEAHILRNKGTGEEVKDVFQDGLVILFNQVVDGRFKRESTIKTYLFAICKNLWLKRLSKRRNKTDLEMLPDTPDEQQDIEAELIGTEEEQLVAKLVAKLGAPCQEILTLFYYEKHSMKQIRDMLRLASEQVAKNKKLKCMKKLREMILNHPQYVRELKK